MYGSDERIERLGKAMISNARECADKIIKDAEKKYEEILCNAKTEYEEKSKSELLAQSLSVRNRFAKEISAYDFEMQKNVLQHRNSIVSDLFEQITERIRAFTASDDYADHIKKLISDARNEKSFKSDTVIYLSSNDASFMDCIRSEFSVSVEIDRKIVLGGILVHYPSDSIYIDKTLDTALERQKKDFVKHSEFSM